MKVGQAMCRELVTASPSATVAQVADLFSRHAVSAVPVVDDLGNLVGIVSEGDLIRSLLPRYSEILEEERYLHDWELMEERAATVRGRPITEIMTSHVYTVAEDAPLLKAAALIQLHHVKRLPVVRGDKLVGVISRTDICRALLGDSS